MGQLRLSVPRAHAQALRALSSVDESQWKAAVENLSEGTTTRPAAVGAMQETGIPLGADDIDTILVALAGLWRVSQRRTIDVALVAEAAAETPSLKLDDKTQQALVARLAAGLRSTAIQRLSKALDLQTDRANVFLNAREFSDVRHLFEGDDATPGGAVVTHTLKIEYATADGIKTLFLGLDDSDLALLRATVERASAKGDSLKSIYAGLGVVIYEPDTQEDES